MLFYYFNSKRDLFDYLLDYGTKYVMDEYIYWLDENETDFIEKYRSEAKVKMTAYFKNPHIFNFLGSIYLNSDVELPGKIKARLAEIRETQYRSRFSNIDTSLFRRDIPADRVIKLIQWTLDGYEQELNQTLRGRDLETIDVQFYWDDFVEHLDLLKRVYYREGVR